MFSDGKVIEYTLSKGVKFHSGDPFTARDVQFSHDRNVQFNRWYQGYA